MTAKAVISAIATLALAVGTLYLAGDPGVIVCGVRDFPPSCASTHR